MQAGPGAGSLSASFDDGYDDRLRCAAQRLSGNLLLAGRSLLPNWRRILAIASYEVVGSGGVWRVKHDGEPIGSYPTKEAAFEAAVAAALEIIREGYEVQISVPGKRMDA